MLIIFFNKLILVPSITLKIKSHIIDVFKYKKVSKFYSNFFPQNKYLKHSSFPLHLSLKTKAITQACGSFLED